MSLWSHFDRTPRMRTTLLLALVALSFGLTAANLLLIRVLLTRQIADSLESDLQHSVDTFRNLSRQRTAMLHNESALLADLPSLKALLTTRDRPTIQDAGAGFWQLSGSDLFALIDMRGHVLASYNRGAPLPPDPLQSALSLAIDDPETPRTIAVGSSPFVVAVQPVYFGPSPTGTALGFVAIGYALDRRVLSEVSQAAAAEVAFSVDGQIVASTLSPALESSLRGPVHALSAVGQHSRPVKLDGSPFLSSATPLSRRAGPGTADVDLIVLKSYDQASRLLHQVNRWGLVLGLAALFIAALLAILISRMVTRPLEALAAGAAALGRGDFAYKLPSEGAHEILELGAAFNHMRVALNRTQQELLEAERLATIGRMASSISHDLRHHLSAVYANAEFLSLTSSSQRERDELLVDIQSAVQDMTDLLDSLLIFSQTGRSFHPSLESITHLVERTAALLRSHPDARGVEIVLDDMPLIEAWVDSRKLSRAVYNLLLNACQAARRAQRPGRVTLNLAETPELILISVSDNGAGVPHSMRETIFQPFVSLGKESGTGLGLTLARHIAQEHGGRVILSDSTDATTVFTIVLVRSALVALREQCLVDLDRKDQAPAPSELQS